MKDISTTNLLNILEQNQITAENLSDYVSEVKDTYPNRNIFQIILHRIQKASPLPGSSGTAPAISPVLMPMIF